MGSDHSNGVLPVANSLFSLRITGRISALLYAQSRNCGNSDVLGHTALPYHPSLREPSVWISRGRDNNSAPFGHIQASGAQVRGGDVSEAEWFWQPELRVDELLRRSCQKPIQVSFRIHERKLTVYE